MGRALRSVATPSSDPTAVALRALATALAPLLRELLESERRDGELVDVATFVGITKQRAIAEPCRRGDLAGAVKIARRWKAPRASVDAWLRSKGPRLVTEQDEDELESMRRRLARSSR